MPGAYVTAASPLAITLRPHGPFMNRLPAKGIAAYVGRTAPEWVDAPPPDSLPADQVICRTLQLGVCGTDREIIHSGRPWVPEGSEYLILGHECLARVEELGSEVRGFQAGDLVVPSVRRAKTAHVPRPDMLPPDQYSERGILEQHGFSQPLWRDDPHYLLPVPAALDDLAVFAEPQSVAEKAVNEAEILQQARLGGEIWRSKPPRVLVTGMGPIGFAGVIAAWSRGWPVTLYDRDPEDSPRVRLALGLEVDYLQQQQVDLADLPDSQRFDLVLECTGSDEVLIAASHALGHCGAMVWLGASRDAQPRSHNLDDLMRRAIMGNHLHLGTVNSAPRDFDQAIAHLLALKREKPQVAAGLITRRAAIGDALDHFTHREPHDIKTVFMYE